MTNSRELVQRVIKIRKYNKITQTEVARRMKTSQSAISEIESGHTKSPQVDTFLRYVQACDAGIAVLIYLPEDLAGPGGEQEGQAESEQATGDQVELGGDTESS